MQLPLIHFDCKYFEGDKPCNPNKDYGVFCGNCNYYVKDYEIKGVFPPIDAPIEIKSGQSEHKKIIIIKLDAVGDVLRTTSILPSLKKYYPDSSITWITKEKSFPVLEDNSLIDEIYFMEEDLTHIYNDTFDIAINLDSGKESCAIMSGVHAEAGFGYHLVNGKPYPVNDLANEWYLMGVDDNSKKANLKTYHRIIHEICGLPYENSKPFLELTPQRIKSAKIIKDKFGLGKYSEFVLVNLGGGNRWQYKKWIKENYIQLINLLAENKTTAVGVIAGGEDVAFYNEIVSGISNSDNIIKFGFGNPAEDFISIIYLADKIFTSDSLAFHIATALDKYCIVIVGPTSHTELDVFGKGKIIFSDKVDCLCCYLNKCDKTITCMNTLMPEYVLNLLK